MWQVLVGWARVEEDGRAAAEDRLAQAQHAITQHTHALNDARVRRLPRGGTQMTLSIFNVLDGGEVFESQESAPMTLYCCFKTVLQASVREKEGTIQKLCLDQEALANKCGELAKVPIHLKTP
jgi:hypothetical protein